MTRSGQRERKLPWEEMGAEKDAPAAEGGSAACAPDRDIEAREAMGDGIDQVGIGIGVDIAVGSRVNQSN
jgi:hypothetical protein